MRVEHLDFITFCVVSLADALHWSASRVYSALRSSGLLMGYIVPCYDVLHSIGKDYFVEDLTEPLREKGVSEYELDEDLTGFAVKRFEAYDEAWLDYVAECRRGGIPAQQYDAVEGGLADMHCRSDDYLADELLLELEDRDKIN